jgi:hypothetical protein
VAGRPGHTRHASRPLDGEGYQLLVELQPPVLAGVHERVTMPLTLVIL